MKNVDACMYKYCQLAIGGFVGALVGWSVVMGDLLLVAVAVAVGLSLDYFFVGLG